MDQPSETFMENGEDMNADSLLDLGKFLDRDSSVPLYLQLKSYLLEKIRNGDLVEGDMLPTELDFQNSTGLSRATIRQAFSELVNEEYIRRHRGVGTTVGKKKFVSQAMRLTSFSEHMSSRGFVSSSKTVGLNFVYPPQKVVELSEFDPQERVWEVKRIRYADGIPVGIHDLYIPPMLQISPRVLQNMESYYKILTDELHIPPVHATESITAKSVTKKEAELLNMTIGAPVLVIWRVAYSASEEVIEVCRMLHDAERYEYKTQLYRD
jgi:GntR family transcriptional regulator